MSEPIQNRRVNVRGIIIKDGKLFCQKLKNPRTVHVDELWSIPGGGIDFGESLQDGLTREMIEETGIKPKIGNLLFIQQFMAGEREQLEFFFHIKNANDYEVIKLEETTHGMVEVAECGFVDPKTTHILPKFLSELNLEQAIADSRPMYINYEEH
jgi:ADP-ribose pyrophosphatase YjhB (NUDIX family)